MEPSIHHSVSEKVLGIVRSSPSWEAAKQRILSSFGDTYLDVARAEGRRVHGFDWVTDPMPASSTSEPSLADVVWMQNLVHDSGSWAVVMDQVRRRLGASRLQHARRIAKETRGIAWVHEPLDPRDSYEERLRKKLMSLDDSEEDLRAAGLAAAQPAGSGEAPGDSANSAPSLNVARAAGPSPRLHPEAAHRARFQEMSERERDSFLHRRIPELGFEIHAASAGSAVSWSTAQRAAGQTPAGRKLLLRSAFEKAAAFAVTFILFFTPTAWWLCLLLGLLVVGYAFWRHVAHTRRAVVRAASSDLDTFDMLWSMGAIALFSAARADHYSNRPNATRWQDVVLYAMDWHDLATDAPIARREAMQKLLDDILPKIATPT